MRLRMKGIGSIRLHLHRALPSAPVACKVKREGRHWYALLTVEIACATERTGPAVGIDTGITTLAALSTGELIANARPARRAEREMRRHQRQLSRCKRGSKRRRKVKARLTALHGKIVRTRETHLHQVSASLTQRFGVIAVEKLNIKGLAGAMLAHANGGMDVSDGFVGDLTKMLDVSGVSARVPVYRLPLSRAARAAIAADPGLFEVAATTVRGERAQAPDKWKRSLRKWIHPPPPPPR